MKHYKASDREHSPFETSGLNWVSRYSGSPYARPRILGSLSGHPPNPPCQLAPVGYTTVPERDDENRLRTDEPQHMLMVAGEPLTKLWLWVIYGLYRGYIGIMEKKMETTI